MSIPLPSSPTFSANTRRRQVARMHQPKFSGMLQPDDLLGVGLTVGALDFCKWGVKAIHHKRKKVVSVQKRLDMLEKSIANLDLTKHFSNNG